MNATQTLALLIARDVYLEDGDIKRFRAALEAGGIENGKSDEPGILMHDLLEWQLLYEDRDAERARRSAADAEARKQMKYEGERDAKEAEMVAELKQRAEEKAAGKVTGSLIRVWP